jgi:short-subunit dehydrogenase involved in D-alanine esterification of teichoic acids
MNIRGSSARLPSALATAGHCAEWRFRVNRCADLGYYRSKYNSSVLRRSTNTVGPALLTQVCVPFLDKGREKKIVNITSTLGSIASADAFGPGAVASYSMSKTALNMLVRAPDCVV